MPLTGETESKKSPGIESSTYTANWNTKRLTKGVGWMKLWEIDMEYEERTENEKCKLKQNLYKILKEEDEMRKHYATDDGSADNNLCGL